jgi:hypothetical protein
VAAEKPMVITCLLQAPHRAGAAAALTEVELISIKIHDHDYGIMSLCSYPNLE